MDKINIIGAGGHARSVLSILKNMDGIIIMGIFNDQYEPGETILEIPILGKISEIPQDIYILNALGDINKRKQIIANYENLIWRKNIFHESAVIDSTVKMGYGNQILAQSFINVESVIGNNNIINSKATIEHECQIGNNNHISVNSTVCGRVTIKDNCFISAGATIIDKVSICSDVTVGAGSTVISDIIEPGVYVGHPVRKIS